MRERRLSQCLPIAGVQGVAQLIDPESACNNLAQRRTDAGDLWMIMERAPGLTLKEFVSRPHTIALPIPEVIRLALNLIRIIKQVHARGVEHQNISPEHILIEWDQRSSSTDQAQLTLFSFSQASPAQRWYQAPQATVQGLSSTVDASGVCAIVFQLITKTDPRHENGKAPHEQAREELNRIITEAVLSQSMFAHD